MKIKTLIMMSAAVLAFPFAASAADLPVKAPIYKAPPPVAVYNWGGCYGGGNVGYSWGSSTVTGNRVDVNAGDLPAFHFDLSDVSSGVSQDLHPNGVIGGLQIGCNYQFQRNWVLGVETDFQWSDQKDSQTGTHEFGFSDSEGALGGIASASIESKLKWLGTVRGRFGYVADSMPNVLWYGTGGLAYASIETSATASATGNVINWFGCGNNPGCTFAGQLSASDTKTQLGWTIGAGVEVALVNHWSVKAEYLYVDLGTVDGNAPFRATYTCSSCIGVATGTIGYSNRMTDNIVRVGVNYKFW